MGEKLKKAVDAFDRLERQGNGWILLGAMIIAACVLSAVAIHFISSTPDTPLLETAKRLSYDSAEIANRYLKNPAFRKLDEKAYEHFKKRSIQPGKNFEVKLDSGAGRKMVWIGCYEQDNRLLPKTVKRLFFESGRAEEVLKDTIVKWGTSNHNLFAVWQSEDKKILTFAKIPIDLIENNPGMFPNATEVTSFCKLKSSKYAAKTILPYTKFGPQWQQFESKPSSPSVNQEWLHQSVSIQVETPEKDCVVLSDPIVSLKDYYRHCWECWQADGGKWADQRDQKEEDDRVVVVGKDMLEVIKLEVADGYLSQQADTEILDRYQPQLQTLLKDSDSGNYLLFHSKSHPFGFLSRVKYLESTLGDLSESLDEQLLKLWPDLGRVIKYGQRRRILKLLSKDWDIEEILKVEGEEKGFIYRVRKKD